jgi:hypothetical protein
MTDSLFFNITDILATEERLNAEFQLDCFNLDSLDYFSVRLETPTEDNPHKIKDEFQEE